jgi:Flp pilus assembly protein TadB
MNIQGDSQKKTPQSNGFYVLAVVLAVIALFLQCLAKSEMEERSRIRSEKIQTVVKQHPKVEPDTNLRPSYAAERTLRNIGFVFTGFGIVCAFTAANRGERGWYLILTGLLFIGVFVTMLL